ncbi:MAG TPA: CAP domain-containing protein [Microthrixaceae bacterium]|nr:CAP domain-containing protein [Microthrixaceae bacterium]
MVLAILATATVMTGCDPEHKPLENWYYVNKERTSRGLKPLGYDGQLAAKARGWAEVLASRGALAHSTLTDGVSPGWRTLGENVGYGGSVLAVHGGFLNSRDHREVMLGRAYQTMGVGVVERGGTTWVVEVYKG